MLDIPPRWSLLIGALVAIPLAVYGLDRGDPIAALSGLSVVVILVSLFIAFRPPEMGSTAPA